MAYAVRPFEEADAPALARLTLAAIREIGPVGYTDEQVAAWSARHTGPERILERARNGAAIFVAADHDNAAVAYALLEIEGGQGGHLDMLYCHPDHTRRGLAEHLLAETEAWARSNDVARLFTEASELARPAFERAGYEVQHRRDFDIDGVAIHNFAMQKQLV